jgi:hypothetical protein
MTHEKYQKIMELTDTILDAAKTQEVQTFYGANNEHSEKDILVDKYYKGVIGKTYMSNDKITIVLKGFCET